jgi:hypothetical protein
MIRRALMIVAMSLAMLLSAPVVHAAPERRGSVAFHYGGALSPEQLAFFSRFDVLVTHDPLPAAQVAALHASGTRLALYEWSVAFYRTLVRQGTWQERLLRGDRHALLNAQPLHGHAGADDADAFYYDPASAEHTRERVRAIASRLHSVHYDGVFLDTTTKQSVHPEALAEFQRRHVDLDYDAAFAHFLAALRGKVHLIVTNQGYRDADHYLKYADYDITESLLTRPWHDATNRWNSVDFLVPELILSASRRYPNVRFVHLNYADGTDTAQFETIVATARLFDEDAYVAAPDLNRTLFSDLYFLNLGKPRSDIRRNEQTATRTFEHGRVVVTSDGAHIERAIP